MVDRSFAPTSFLGNISESLTLLMFLKDKNVFGIALCIGLILFGIRIARSNSFYTDRTPKSLKEAIYKGYGGLDGIEIEKVTNGKFKGKYEYIIHHHKSGGKTYITKKGLQCDNTLICNVDRLIFSP